MASHPAPAQALATLRTADAGLGAFAAVRDDASAAALAQQPAGPAGRAVGGREGHLRHGGPAHRLRLADLPGHRPAAEAALVGVIRRAGGLVIGKSVTTEFAFLQPAATLNPAAPGCTPGGSSAGSAAAVAAGLVPLAVGTQTGGSTIRPASYCGVVGFKPSFGLLPTAGMKCFSWSLDTVGLFARTVDEVRRFAQALSGGRIAMPPARAPGEWVVGIPDAYPWGDVSASAQQAMARGADALRQAGARVVPCTTAILGRRRLHRPRRDPGLGSGAGAGT